MSQNNDSSASILNKLEAALNSDGDFPVRARVVSELRKLIDDPRTPIERIVEIILGEPSLGTRILHVVNSVFYQRNHPIMTVSQAVIQLGMRALTDLCTSLVLIQRFSPVARKGGIFADNVKKCIVCSLLTSALAREAGEKDEERGYLAGTFFTIGPLLLAYYFPQVYESAEKRAQKRNQSVSQSVTETLGVSPAALSLGIVDSLSIPQFYRDLLIGAYSIYVDENAGDISGINEELRLARALAMASRVTDAIIDSGTKQELSLALEQLCSRFTYSRERLDAVLQHVPKSFEQQSSMMEMSFLNLPEYFDDYLAHNDLPPETAFTSLDTHQDEFNYYLDEIREAISNQETLSSVITSVMEALAFGLKFDRVLLMFADPKGIVLQGKMGLGASFGDQPQAITRRIPDEGYGDNPDSTAFVEGTVETFGEPVFTNGWPFAAIPIGGKERTVGVIYADKMGPEAEPLTERTQIALSLIADLLDKSVAENSG